MECAPTSLHLQRKMIAVQDIVLANIATIRTCRGRLGFACRITCRFSTMDFAVFTIGQLRRPDLNLAVVYDDMRYNFSSSGIDENCGHMRLQHHIFTRQFRPKSKHF